MLVAGLSLTNHFLNHIIPCAVQPWQYEPSHNLSSSVWRNKAVYLSNSLPHGWTQKWTKSPCPLTWWCLVLGAPDTYRIESGPLEWSLTKSSCLRMNGWGRKMKNIMANCLGMKTQTCWPSICKLIKNKNLTQLSHQELIVETLHGYQA